MNNIFYYCVSFFVAVLFCLVGFVCMLLPWTPEIKRSLIQFIFESPVVIFFIGVILMTCGLAVIAYIYTNSKRRTYYVKKGSYSIGVDQEVLNRYLSTYFKQLIPTQDIPHQVLLRKKKLYLHADLPFVPEDQKNSMIEKIYEEILSLLADNIGFKDELHLTVSFQVLPQE